MFRSGISGTGLLWDFSGTCTCPASRRPLCAIHRKVRFIHHFWYPGSPGGQGCALRPGRRPSYHFSKAAAGPCGGHRVGFSLHQHCHDCEAHCRQSSWRVPYSTVCVCHQCCGECFWQQGHWECDMCDFCRAICVTSERHMCDQCVTYAGPSGGMRDIHMSMCRAFAGVANVASKLSFNHRCPWLISRSVCHL
jgi:hypothetical protein